LLYISLVENVCNWHKTVDIEWAKQTHSMSNAALLPSGYPPHVLPQPRWSVADYAPPKQRVPLRGSVANYVYIEFMEAVL
jgi:hypothetical protein